MKKKVSVCLALMLSLGMAVPTMAAHTDAVYGTENNHVIPAGKGQAVTTPDGKFTVSNVLRQTICTADDYKGSGNCVGVPIYWVPATGTEVRLNGAKYNDGFSLGDMLFYEVGHADDNMGYGYYTDPLKVWLNAEEQAKWEANGDDFYYKINYGGSRLFLCFDKADSFTPPAFTDVKAGMYYEKPVQWAVQNKIASGTSKTTFSPDQDCTRGQIITFLYKAADAPAVSAANPFGDVKQGEYFYHATAWAAENDVAAGRQFAPNARCTRAMAAEFIWRAMGKPAPAVTENPFTDISATDPAYQAILWAVGEKITGGTSATTFSPDAVCTRGQIATFLYKAFN